MFNFVDKLLNFSNNRDQNINIRKHTFKHFQQLRLIDNKTSLILMLKLQLSAVIDIA